MVGDEALSKNVCSCTVGGSHIYAWAVFFSFSSVKDFCPLFFLNHFPGKNVSVLWRRNKRVFARRHMDTKCRNFQGHHQQRYRGAETSQSPRRQQARGQEVVRKIEPCHDSSLGIHQATEQQLRLHPWPGRRKNDRPAARFCQVPSFSLSVVV